MKKVSQINWNRYKESESGKKAIQEFEKFLSCEMSPKEMYDVYAKYNPEFTQNFGKKEIEHSVGEIEMFRQILSDLLDNRDSDLNISPIDLFMYFIYDWSKTIEEKDWD